MGRHPANRNRFRLHISFRGLPNRRKKEEQEDHHHNNGTWHYLSVASVDRHHHHDVHDDHDHEFDEPCCISTTTNTTGTASMDNSTERRSLISLDSCLSTSSSARSINERKHVHFGDCEVRRYSQILGDHPYCSNGCPIELGWSYLETTRISVDDYEQDHRNVDDDNEDLRLSYEERRTILSGYTDGEVRRSNRRMNREQRSCCYHHSHSRRSHNKGVNLFFSSEVPQVPPPAVQD